MSAALAAAQKGTEILLGLGTTLVVLTGIFVAVRLVWDYRAVRRFHADDYLSVAAVILLAATLAIFYVFLQAYTEGGSSNYRTSNLIVAQALISGFATWFAKAPILVLYMRIFGVRVWVRRTCWFVLTATAIAYLVACAYNAAGCVPPRENVSVLFVIDCTYLSSVTGVTLGSIAVAVDCIIFLIPMPIIFRLHLSLQKKLGLFVVFLAGSLAIVASAVALYYKVGSLSGTSTDVTTAVILTIVELSIAICVGCTPAARSFWVDIVEATAVYTALASWTSQLTLRFSTPRRSATGASSPTAASSKQNQSLDSARKASSVGSSSTAPHRVQGYQQQQNHPYRTLEGASSHRSERTTAARHERSVSDEVPLADLEGGPYGMAGLRRDMGVTN